MAAREAARDLSLLAGGHSFGGRMTPVLLFEAFVFRKEREKRAVEGLVLAWRPD
jgi:hypothetical protein